MKARLPTHLAASFAFLCVAATLGFGVSAAEAFTTVTVGRNAPPSYSAASGTGIGLLGIVLLAVVLGALAFVILAARCMAGPQGSPGEPQRLDTLDGSGPKHEMRKAA